MNLVNLARNVAWYAHVGMVDKSGRPHVEHVWRVGDAVAARGAPDYVVVAAYLHDVVEDGVMDPGGVLALFGPRVLRLVKLLSRDPGVSYADYVDRIAGDRDASLVKCADLDDNLRPGAGSLVKRYRKARARLGC